MRILPQGNKVTPLRPRRFNLSTALAFVLLSLLTACGGGTDVTPSPGGTPSGGSKLSVVASFYPIEFFARRIGGDLVDIYNPVPPGAEPHDLELTPRAVERIQKSRVLLYLGHGFQPAIDRALDTVKGPNLLMQDVSQGIDLMPAGGDPSSDNAGAGQAALDPHVWLDPVDAQKMASTIADTLATADPANADTYRANAAQLTSDLAALDTEFKSSLATCKRKELVTAHSAFGYLARRYGLEQVPITGLSPEAEPTPARLQEIIDFARTHDVKYIFFETLVDPRVADVIAREVGAQTLVLNPIEGLTQEQVAAGDDYFSLMGGNLTNLRTGLDCSQ
jgi:zinc transport system substrate-binding protein